MSPQSLRLKSSQKSWSSGKVPEDWSTANMLLIASSLPAGLAFHPEGHIRHQRTILRVAELQEVPTLRESEMLCAAVGAAVKAWAPADDALPLLPFKEPPEVLGAGQKRCRSRTSPETPLVEEIETAEAIGVVGRPGNPTKRTSAAKRTRRWLRGLPPLGLSHGAVKRRAVRVGVFASVSRSGEDGGGDGNDWSGGGSEPRAGGRLPGLDPPGGEHRDHHHGRGVRGRRGHRGGLPHHHRVLHRQPRDGQADPDPRPHFLLPLRLRRRHPGHRRRRRLPAGLPQHRAGPAAPGAHGGQPFQGDVLPVPGGPDGRDPGGWLGQAEGGTGVFCPYGGHDGSPALLHWGLRQLLHIRLCGCFLQAWNEQGGVPDFHSQCTRPGHGSRRLEWGCDPPGCHHQGRCGAQGHSRQ